MENALISLDTARSLWDQFFTVAPLVIIGTKEKDSYNLAPKHMAMPLGWENYFGFICTPDHATYHNVLEHKAFTVSFPQASQVVVTSLTASPRCGDGGSKPALLNLETIPAQEIDGVFINEAYLYLECRLEKIIDGFGNNSLIAGNIIAAHVREEYLRQAPAEDQEQIFRSPLLVYLNPGRFGFMKESYAFPFPSEFKK